MHTLTIDGHVYSVDHTAPRLVILSMMSTAQQRMLTGQHPSSEAFLGSEFVTLLEDQQDDIHRVTAGACSCGLVAEDAWDLGGHRDLGTADIACTYVVADHEHQWAMACQACRLTIPAYGLRDARKLMHQHICAWDFNAL